MTTADTVTETDFETDPTLFVAVNVYDVVADGVTTYEVTELTLIAPGFKTKLAAPEAEKLKVELCPAAILAGLAENDEITGADGAGVPEAEIICICFASM